MPHKTEREKEQADNGRAKALELRRQTSAEIDWDGEVLPRFKNMIDEIYRRK